MFDTTSSRCAITSFSSLTMLSLYVETGGISSEELQSPILAAEVMNQFGLDDMDDNSGKYMNI